MKVKIPDDNTRASLFGARNEIASWLRETEETYVSLRGDIHHVATILSMHYGVPMSGIVAHAIAHLWEEVRDEIPVDSIKRYDRRIRAFKACRAKHLKATGANKYHAGIAKGPNETGYESRAERESRLRQIEEDEKAQQAAQEAAVVDPNGKKQS